MRYLQIIKGVLQNERAEGKSDMKRSFNEPSGNILAENPYCTNLINN